MNPLWFPLPTKTALKRLLGVFLQARDCYVGESPTVLLVLSHMRSGSSLLHHILISHPEIIGYGERNAVYAAPQDFDRLRVDVYAHRGQLLRCHRYVADQLNHNHLLASDALLNHPQVRTIFLIREPSAAIASLVGVLGKFYTIHVDEAAAYYRERLATLVRYARCLQDRSRAFVLTYDDLVKTTEPTLQSLSTFLQLKTELTERYQRFAFTGQRGDPSVLIYTGRILRDKATHSNPLKPHVLTRLQDLYQDCRQTLETCCVSCQPEVEPY